MFDRVLTAVFSIGAYFYGLYVLTAWLLFQMNFRSQSTWDPTLRALFPFAIDFDGDSVSNSGGGGIDSANLVRNCGAMLLFSAHHWTFARQFVKRHLPEYLERSMFVAVCSGILHFVLWQWSDNHLHSDQQVLFRMVEPGTTGYAVYCGLMLLSWLFLVAASFNIDHFDLFGLKQGVLGSLRADYIDPNGWWLMKAVRHPMMSGLLGVLVLSPIGVTTYDRLLFSALNILHIAVGVYLEEGDLRGVDAQKWDQYCRNVPDRFVPSGCPFIAGAPRKKKD